MNTSQKTNQNHDLTTSTPRTTAPQFRRRTMGGALLAMAITATAVGFAATSHANPGVPAHAGANCKTDPWGFLGSQRRTLCDGPIARDGSWTRERTIWAPAHVTSYSCYSTPGRSYSSTNCSGGYFVPERLISNETYPVRPETVLRDEPGHLAN